MLPQTRRASSEMATLQRGAEHIAALLRPGSSADPPLISPVKMTARRVPLSQAWQVNEMKQLDWRHKSPPYWADELEGAG